jgi:hypothetical protein
MGETAFGSLWYILHHTVIPLAGSFESPFFPSLVSLFFCVKRFCSPRTRRYVVQRVLILRAAYIAIDSDLEHSVICALGLSTHHFRFSLLEYEVRVAQV